MQLQLYETYPFAFGPRLGIAYQIDSKTVFRAGWGVTYEFTGSYNYITNSPIVGVGFNTLTFTSPSYGDPATLLRNGLQYNPASLYSASLNPGIRPDPADQYATLLDRSRWRPAAAYHAVECWTAARADEGPAARSGVGGKPRRVASGQFPYRSERIDRAANRGGRAGYQQRGGQNTAHLPLDSALAQSRGFKAPYPGYPLSLTVAQTLRPFPQFGSIPVFWAPLGDNWYDSLQAKLTKRYSRGLTLSSAFTWQKELVSGAEAETGSAVPVNDVFNRKLQKYISGFSQPLVLVTGFSYQLPAVGPGKWIKAMVRDWTAGGILRYSSGLPILVPASNNALNALLFRNTSAATFADRVPGVPLFLKDLNAAATTRTRRSFLIPPPGWIRPRGSSGRPRLITTITATGGGPTSR